MIPGQVYRTFTAYDEVYLENDRKWTGETIVPFSCQQCGYIEPYKGV